ncbi:hypothetical protein ACIBPB_12140 [Micromonospora sp. NPDC049836]|uniref:hypothetical protein n=1 Tax=Micromonospora sp. NPDC049836 TaxID=3364274 RepID=UPI0037AF2577
MADLDRELRELAAWLETPEPPELAARVRARLAEPVTRRRRWRRWLAAAVAALLVGALPPARAAVADAVTGLLRFSGIAIGTAPVPVSPSGTPAPLPSQRAVALDEARRLVRFPIRVPAALGPPDRVLVADPDAGGRYRVATLLYRSGALRLDTFDGRLDVVFQKQASGPGVEWTQVAGGFAVWVAGPHPVAYVDRAGEVRVETARLAAKTLIWERDGASYRLEGDLAPQEAVTIAESLG